MIKSLASGAALALALSLPAFAQDLTVFDYSGFEDPSFHEGFIATHGSSPEFVFFGDEDEAFQRLVSGFRSDVTHICAGSVPRWQASGIIEPWDTAQIAAFATLNSDLVGADVLAGSEDLYFLPIDFGSTAVTYNTADVPEADVASLEVFTNPAYAGRLSIPDNVDDAYALAYLATGVSGLVGCLGGGVQRRDRLAAGGAPQPADLLGRSCRDHPTACLGRSAGELVLERGAGGHGG